MSDTPPPPPSSSASNGAPPSDPQAIAARAEEIVAELLKRLNFEVSITSRVAPDEIRLRLVVEEPARLIGRRGATINDLQFLATRILHRAFKEMPRLYLDVSAPEDQVAARISDRLRELADQVRRWGNPVDLGALDPTEREAAVNAFARDRELEVAPAAPAPNADGRQPMRLQLRGTR